MARKLKNLILLLTVSTVVYGCTSDQSTTSEISDPTGDTATGESTIRETTISDSNLVRELRDGGEVIYLRHSTTDSLQTDEILTDLGDCSTQRNLTREGRVQAKQIGEAFTDLELPTGEVLSSPYCRTRQTAHLAFGREAVQTTRDLLSPEYVPLSEAGEVEDYATTVNSLISTPPGEGENKVLVGHESILREVTGESIEEGGAVIFEPLGDGDFRVLGTVGAKDWQGLSR